MLRFQSKAETLENVAPLLQNGVVLPQVRFNAGQWIQSKARIVESFDNYTWFNHPVIVRSSAHDEDSQTSCTAGVYLSVLNVTGIKEICSAIDSVFASYKRFNRNDQVFIQPMVQDITMCGVALTKDPDTGSHYIVLNYDQYSKSSDSITSGKSQYHDTIYYDISNHPKIDEPFSSIIKMIDELIELFDFDALDIEFATDRAGTVYLLQVRPLPNALYSFSKCHQKGILNELYSQLSAMQLKESGLAGDYTLYGVMPDWNPAEVIGLRPYPLALSMYKELITNTVWSKRRFDFGYRDVRHCHLLLDFYGLPYIDLRRSFNSLIPADLPDSTAEKIANIYLEDLKEKPHLHDKIEFFIILSSFTLDIDERMLNFKQRGLTSQECLLFTKSLKQLTNRILQPDFEPLKKDIENIRLLIQRQCDCYTKCPDPEAHIQRLIQDCKDYGTTTFAGIARAAFIGRQILDSMVNCEIICEQEMYSFLHNLSTITENMSSDYATLDQKSFLEIYGHLRPGTYDILNLSYNEEPDRFFNFQPGKSSLQSTISQETFLNEQQSTTLSNALASHGIQCDSQSLLQFIRNTLEMREYSKFVFSRNVSSIFSALKNFGEMYDIQKEELSYADIQIFLEQGLTTRNRIEKIKKSIIQGKERYAITKGIQLPLLITTPEDAFSFKIAPSEPSFVTMNSVQGRIVCSPENWKTISGSIVAIQNADPGYDWLFMHNICGLITMFGGRNSHMAIRASQLNIPAVIGTGMTNYKMWSNAHVIQIDCLNRKVTVIE